jgi:transposase-like protein
MAQERVVSVFVKEETAWWMIRGKITRDSRAITKELRR